MKQRTVKSHLLQQAEALAKDCTAFAESLKQKRDCQDVVLQIIQLAMMNKDVIHIHADYHPHVDVLYVCVQDAKTDYKNQQESIHTKRIDLLMNCADGDTPPLSQLLELEDKLLELIAEAKDKLEVAA